MDVIVIPTGESIPGMDFCPPGSDNPDRCYRKYEQRLIVVSSGAGWVPQMIRADGIERASNARRIGAASALKDFLTKRFNPGAWPT
jgi:hypothetical protein